MVNLFKTDDYEDFAFYPRFGLTMVESHIRASNPIKYSPLTIQDTRFSNSSWMRIHACSLFYITLWCVKPQNSPEIKIAQHLTSILIKPIAACSDACVNTILLAAKVVIAVNDFFVKVIKKCIFLEKDAGFAVSGDYWKATISQLGITLKCYLEVVLQPITILPNIVSPKYDFNFLFDRYNWSYLVKNKDTDQDEIILDQGKVKYLRERLGWEHVTDEVFKTLLSPGSSAYRIEYSGEDKKLFVTAEWTTYVQAGNVWIPIHHRETNY